MSACRRHRWPGLLPGPPLAQQPWAPFPGRRQAAHSETLRRQAAHGETLDRLCRSHWTPPRVTRKQATPTKLHVGTPECKFPLVPQLTKHPARDFLCNHVKMWKPSSARGLRGHWRRAMWPPGQQRVLAGGARVAFTVLESESWSRETLWTERGGTQTNPWSSPLEPPVSLKLLSKPVC